MPLKLTHQSNSGIAIKHWANPLLRWAGSKKKLLPHLIKHMPPQFERYIEPFAGSACLFFATNPPIAILGDINSGLFDTYATLTKHPRLVARKVHSHGTSVRKYYALRKLDPQSLDPIDRAARFVYLNRFCFNGVYRTNRKGHFNVPRGIRTGAIPDEPTFFRCAVALRHAELRLGDFEVCVSDVKRGDFVYLDPPYSTPNRRPTGEYGYGSFAHEDHSRLLSCLSKIDVAGGKFLLSYADDKHFVQRLESSWICRRVRVRRHVAGFSQHRACVGEILVSNYHLLDDEG